MKKVFGYLNMTWPRVILFAIITGIYTGLVMLIPFLKDTSFQDIGISYEWWLVFAVILVVNCKKSYEAMLKCFVFFLISQPLVYLVEVLFGSLEFAQGLYYYRTIWLPMTLLTLPGGFIAYFCKKQTVLGGIILGLGNTIQTILAVLYFGMAVSNFPNHLLSAIVCIASIIVMTIFIQHEKRNRIIAFSVPVVLTILIIVIAKLMGRVII